MRSLHHRAPLNRERIVRLAIQFPPPRRRQRQTLQLPPATFARRLRVTRSSPGFTQDQRRPSPAAPLRQAWETKAHFQLGPPATWRSPPPTAYHQSPGPTYYLFRRPDFLYAYAFFPTAGTYT